MLLEKSSVIKVKKNLFIKNIFLGLYAKLPNHFLRLEFLHSIYTNNLCVYLYIDDNQLIVKLRLHKYYTEEHYVFIAFTIKHDKITDVFYMFYAVLS
jgi:hypothetical protein